MGYGTFYDENPNDYDLDTCIQRQERELSQYPMLVRSIQLITGKRPTLSEVGQYYAKDPEVQKFLSYYKSKLTNQQLLYTFQRQGIAYKAIDLPSSVNYEYQISNEGVSERDKLMADEYLNASTPVYGRIGLAHASGIGSLLEINAIPSLFFFVYSQPLSGEELSILSHNQSRIIKINTADMDVNHILERITLYVDPASIVLKKDKLKDYLSICNFLFSHAYHPRLVKRVITEVLIPDTVNKDNFPQPIWLFNVLSAIQSNVGNCQLPEAEKKQINDMMVMQLQQCHDYLSSFPQEDIEDLLSSWLSVDDEDVQSILAAVYPPISQCGM